MLHAGRPGQILVGQDHNAGALVQDQRVPIQHIPPQHTAHVRSLSVLAGVGTKGGQHLGQHLRVWALIGLKGQRHILEEVELGPPAEADRRAHRFAQLVDADAQGIDLGGADHRPVGAGVDEKLDVQHTVAPLPLQLHRHPGRPVLAEVTPDPHLPTVFSRRPV